MNTKIIVGLMLAASVAMESVSHAQMPQWGTGMYGGMQPCPYPNGMAPGATSDNDEIDELKLTIKELNEDIKDHRMELRDATKDRNESRKAITDVVNSSVAGKIFEHMEKGMNCGVCGAGGGPAERVIVREKVVVIQGGPAPIPVPRPNRRAPPVPIPTTPTVQPPVPRPPSKNTMNTFPWDSFKTEEERLEGDRAPADIGVAPATAIEQPTAVETQGLNQSPSNDQDPQSAGVTVGGPVDPVWNMSGGGGGGGGFGGGPTLCNSGDDPVYRSSGWRAICRDGGQISDIVCTSRPFSNGGNTGSCVRALSRYRKAVKDEEEARKQIDAKKDEIKELNREISLLLREKRREARDGLEASATCVDCARRARRSSSSSSSWNTALPLIAGGLMGVAAEGLSYFANKQNNKQLGQLGFPTASYRPGVGVPYFTAGVYGALATSQKGAFGCAPTMAGGGGAFGPNGMMSPYGNMMNPYGMNMTAPWGYPNIMGGGMNPMAFGGGGMYQPGMNPWGMAGPWGNGGAMGPFMGGGAMGGGFNPGMMGGLGGPMGGGFNPAMMGGLGGPMGGGIGGSFSMGPGGFGGSLGTMGAIPGMGIPGGGMMGGAPFGSPYASPYMGPAMMGGMGGMMGGYPGMMGGGYPGGMMGGYPGGGMMPGLGGPNPMMRQYETNAARQRIQYGLASEIQNANYRLQLMGSGMDLGMGGGMMNYGIGGGSFGLGGFNSFNSSPVLGPSTFPSTFPSTGLGTGGRTR